MENRESTMFTAEAVKQTENVSYRDRVNTLIRELSAEFVGRDEESKLAVMALVTRTNLVMIGEPGTAKSAILRSLAERVHGAYYYYLMNKYTIPDEIVGPIDPIAYKNGEFKRLMDNRLPKANIAFIDEIFKASSETLNTLLNVMNERTFVDIDGRIYHVPLISLVAASNELPQGDELAALYDRFLVKHFVQPLPSEKLKEAVKLNLSGRKPAKTTLDMADLDGIYKEITSYMQSHVDDIADIIGMLIGTMRTNGIFVSDRTASSPRYLPILVSAWAWAFRMPVKKATLEVAKYILQDNDEQLNAFAKAMESVYPKDLRDAYNKLTETDELMNQGNLGEAEKKAMEAVNLAQTLVGKENVFDLYKDEINEFVESATTKVKKIQTLKAEISRK